MPAVILLDLELGGMDALKRIRTDERTRLIPVVMLASSTEEDDMMRSYELGANSYVRKPPGSADFAEAVSRVGTYWVLLNQSLPDADDLGR
jgi:two-component system, response regulator